MRLGLVITDSRHTRYWLKLESLQKIAQLGSVVVWISKPVWEASKVAELKIENVSFRQFEHSEPRWLLALHHLIWLDKKSVNDSFRTKRIREYLGDERAIPLGVHKADLMRNFAKVAAFRVQRIFSLRALIGFFPVTRKLLIFVLSKFVVNGAARYPLDFEGVDCCLFPSIGYEPSYWQYFRDLRAQGKKSILVTDNWDNVSSKSLFVVPPDFITTPGDLSAKTTQSLHNFPTGQVWKLGLPKFDVLSELSNPKSKATRILYVGYSQPHDEWGSLRILSEATSGVPDAIIRYRPHPLRKETAFTRMGQLPNTVKIVGKTGSEMAATGGHPPLDSRYSEDLKWADLVVGPPTTMLLEAMLCGRPVLVDARDDGYHLSCGHFALNGYTHMKELLSIRQLRIARTVLELEELTKLATKSIEDWPRGRACLSQIVEKDDRKFIDRLVNEISKL